MVKQTLQNVQFDTLNTYFNTLVSTGYLNDKIVAQIVTAVLLIDTLWLFEDYIDDSYKTQVERILKRLKCCNCSIDWDSLKTVNHPAYNSPTIAPIRTEGESLIIPGILGWVVGTKLFLQDGVAEVVNNDLTIM